MQAGPAVLRHHGVGRVHAALSLEQADGRCQYFAGDGCHPDQLATNTLEIPIGGTKAKLATSHPEGSYRLEDGAAKLVITNPEKFWSISKYLVVVETCRSASDRGPGREAAGTSNRVWPVLASCRDVFGH